ncbi:MULTISPECIES: Rpn family recombination-promoting nuclease/putative transposase [unclassified Butyrivibrio]|uniref:Rpn family recombination-promoting nuclease/putative transposase n=1 Tax=unclassified Butyrivibrio TaxID=2639466 RepID=UPI000876C754|nr:MULTISPECIES: Rpn family recombination-promoting nuclease/putative transposase [unclassified Butyrivibrio]SCY14879.1 Putative transposase, YhgA-like [Butyrivibrio sp. INlla14]SDB52225.1 Putative transposase, YhgA-like [Butyrivibrio sp. INlla16]
MKSDYYERVLIKDMGAKDKTEKSLEDCNDVFADIVNVLLFDGEEIISPDDLLEGSPYSNYTENGKIRDQERDIYKYWNNSQIRLAAIGFENETDEEEDMPLRVINYDAAGYRAQLSKDNNNDRYPVVSLVLYYGYENRWSKAKTLYERLVIPEKLKKYVFDYGMNLFEIAYLEDEQVAKFKSDFRLVADYFVQMRKTGEYVPPTDKIVHVQEMLALMSALTNDNRFVDIYDEVKGKERVSMCTVLDVVEAKGKSKGITEATTITRNEDIKSLAEYFVEKTPSLPYDEALKMAEDILKK